MDPARAARALATATASLTSQHDVSGALATLLDTCREGLGVDAAALLVGADGSEVLEVLTATSHAASELELHHLRATVSPYLEARSTGRPVTEHSRDGLSQQWPEFAEAMTAAGFESVHVSPLHFDRSRLGALGVFRRTATDFTPDEQVVAQAFADIATVLVVHSGVVSTEQVSRQLAEALDGRVLVEQAKGVLADTHDVSMADAYDVLVAGARDQHQSLTSWAFQVLMDARRR